VEFGSSGTVARVAARLVELAEDHGQPGPGGLLIGVPLTQVELAGWVGASREAVVRALSTLRTRGLLTTGRRAIRVLDLDGLRALAD
jgi:CRP/FNR family transcriptional regulator, cyclic AMP receptor protein